MHAPSIENEVHLSQVLRALGTVLFLVAFVPAAVADNPAPTNAPAARPGRTPLDEANDLNRLGSLLLNQGKLSEAERHLRRALDLRERNGASAAELAASLNNLAAVTRQSGESGESERLYRRAIEIFQTVSGGRDSDLASALSNLSVLLSESGRYYEAIEQAGKALALLNSDQTTDPSDHWIAHNNLGLLYSQRGQYRLAEREFKIALDLIQKSLGPDHPDLAEILNNIADLFRLTGSYDEAESAYRRSLTILRGWGVDRPSYAAGLNNLATLYMAQGRPREAMRLFLAAVEINQSVLGDDALELASALNNLAGAQRAVGALGEAEASLNRALEIRRGRLGLRSDAVADSLADLASLALANGNAEDAARHLTEALSIRREVLGAAHPAVATTLNDIALVEEVLQAPEKAKAWYREALEIARTSLGVDHPQVAAILNNFSQLELKQGRDADALALIREASSIERGRLLRDASEAGQGVLAERRASRYLFERHLETLAVVSAANPLQAGALAAEAFEVAQLARASTAGAAIARFASRTALGDSTLSVIVRDRQDMLEALKLTNAQLTVELTEAKNRRDGTRVVELERHAASLEQALKDGQERLRRDYPEFLDRLDASPLSARRLPELLGREDALAFFVVGDVATYAFVVTVDGLAFRRLPVTRSELTRDVAKLRSRLSPSDNPRLLAYDVDLAHDVYLSLFSPFAAALTGRAHLIVVADGPLVSLPMSVLVTTPPPADFGFTQDHRQIAWLLRDYALSYLPDVSSLSALRRSRGDQPSGQPFLGVGDPRLEGGAGAPSGEANGVGASRGLSMAARVNRLEPLPETLEELRSIAHTLGAGDDSLLLGQFATRTEIAKRPLAAYRVIQFATHGLMANEIPGLTEPALVLTPPTQASLEDDGLFTASDISQLKLSAEWVVLSACNTAADERSAEGEGYSGLARAFFYAGARTVLVSHWPVASVAAVQLTTRAFDSLRLDSSIGRGEAMRRSMLSLIDTDSNRSFSHPLFWGPFVVVGEGWAKRAAAGP